MADRAIASSYSPPQEKTYKIGDGLWYQMMEMAMPAFVASDEDEIVLLHRHGRQPKCNGARRIRGTKGWGRNGRGPRQDLRLRKGHHRLDGVLVGVQGPALARQTDRTAREDRRKGQKAAEGARYVGWIPVRQTSSGKTLEFDLIFEVE